MREEVLAPHGRQSEENLDAVCDDVLIYKEKALIWVYYPVEALLVEAILKSKGIDVAIYADTIEQRDKTKKRLTLDDSLRVLVATYFISGIVLNLQHRCRNVYLLTVPGVVSQRDQAIARVHRLGQMCVVKQNHISRQTLSTISKWRPPLPDIYLWSQRS